MLSHKHKCIFVHIPKVAGISIEQVFIDSLGLDFANRASLLLGNNNNKGKGPKQLSHLTAQEYLQYSFVSEEIFNAYFKFAFVRDPYDRVYSFYKYLGYAKLVSFEKFIIDYLSRIFDDKDKFYFIKPMYNYIYDDSGKKLVDFVGKIETIEKDFERISRQLKLGNTKLKNLNNSKETDFKNYYIRAWRIMKKYPAVILDISFRKEAKRKIFSEEMKKVVQKYYDSDFTHFGYER